MLNYGNRPLTEAEMLLQENVALRDERARLLAGMTSTWWRRLLLRAMCLRMPWESPPNAGDNRPLAAGE